MPYLAAIIVGAALAASGAALQSLLANPLAEPYILGTVGSAALAAAAACALGLETSLGMWVRNAAALSGAAAGLLLVLAVARSSKNRSKSTIILAGFVVGSFTGSADMVVMQTLPPEQFADLSRWLYGNLSSPDPMALAVASAMVAVSLAGLYSQNRSLDALALGPDTAATLGVNVKKTTLATLACCAAATAAAVSLAGAIGFLGLVVPHAVRRFTGASHRRVLPASALAGALALMAAQYVCELADRRVTAGGVCALALSPVFFAMLAKGGLDGSSADR
ncbi:MAG: iron chelate uptake ABC transporter family permease subunit [Kiritimatiellae bacterium]|nr:iron chelate uptake ABC transporter family permease subunit [Kiritimatiellia bacterium]